MARFWIIAICLLPSLVMAETLPIRKPGLWELVATDANGTSQTMRQCTNESTDAKMMQNSTNMAGLLGVTCDIGEVQKQGDRYSLRTECLFSGSKIISTVSYSGDFTKLYRATVSSSYEPPIVGVSQTSSQVIARWIGECESGQSPGDIMVQGGPSFNVNAFDKFSGNKTGTK